MDLDRESLPRETLATTAVGLGERAIRLDNPLLRPVRVDPTDGYTPEELAVAAVVLNPTLRAARARVAVTDAQAGQATLLANPTLASPSGPTPAAKWPATA